MTFFLLFLAASGAYWGLRALDARTTHEGEALGLVEAHRSVRDAAGKFDAHKFMMRGLLWTAAAGVLFVVGLLTTPVVHGLWLGLYGALVVRSVWTIASNKRAIASVEAANRAEHPRAGHGG